MNPVDLFTDEDWESMSHNDNLNLDVIEKYIHKPWNFCQLTYNVPLWFIEKYYQKDWYWKDIYSKNPDFFLKMLEKYTINIGEFTNIYIENLSGDTKLSINIIKKYPVNTWHWGILTTNPAITMDDIRNNPELPWSKSRITRNPNFFKITSYNCYKKYKKDSHLPLVRRFRANIMTFRNIIYQGHIRESYLIQEIFSNDLQYKKG
jgi:hypothetical protein